MRIALITKDRSLLPLCQEVVAKLPLDHCDVVLAEAEQAVEAEMHIWDLDAKPRIPESRSPGVDVFLVRRNSLKAFLDRFPHAGATTLLKPVSPAALEVFLAHLIGRLNNQGQEPSDPMKADRDALLECLLHSTLRLQEMEDDRTNFWARSAHDLRAPLTAASGYCGLLLEEQFGSLTSGQRELLQRIEHSLKKLNRMASAMFQLTAGKQLERKYELKRTDIESCIERSVDEVRFFALEKNLTLEVDTTPPSQPLYVEPNQIEQVLVNLLENACKFSPRNSVIAVRGYSVPSPAGHVSTAGDRVTAGYRVDINDSGPGVAPEHLQNIFEEYVSYGNAGDRSGGGLGLAICKMILRAHHGEIWAETREKGTTFSFVLPFHPQEAVPHDLEPVSSYAGGQ
ncbi:MAG: HAMP domain-containing histidine kinase [Bryobacterales bacterium]|nr:HAMP domain-containing histidine kinase [Bryobacterales bacterium]MCZ2147192.1 HAMP domain-containing histidine kinase [Bryobacterales bacterium]